VRYVLAGWANTDGALPHDVTVVAGGVGATDFFTHGATITGTVYNDANGNGLLDGSELGKSGVTVFLDLDGSGTLNGGDLSTTTDINGAYSFASLAAATYHVRYVVAAGWLNTDG